MHPESDVAPQSTKTKKIIFFMMTPELGVLIQKHKCGYFMESRTFSVPSHINQD